jgi:nucleoside-diphosphate-sugar epimerase
LKVLLTGASGFVGSHVLESLHEHHFPTAVLLRDTSRPGFLGDNLAKTEVRLGSIDHPDSLVNATADITHVVHCAGRTKAVRSSEFYETNQHGTRQLVRALNARRSGVERLVHISSLAVSGPATPECPATEDAPARPVSEYGKSKLAAELEVRESCRVPFTILRPPAVYGPRDTGFLSMFKAVKHHLLPQPNKAQALSLVYAKDLAEAVVACLMSTVTSGKTYFVASPEVVTGRAMAKEIASQMKRWTIPCPVPALVLWSLCLLQQLISRLTQRATLLNLQKYAELRAPGWVCSPTKLQRELGFSCGTGLQKGVNQTLDWYTREHWL